MKQQRTEGLKRASGLSKNNTPYTFTVWYDPRRNRVFTTNDAFDAWARDYELLGYIVLLTGSRHFRMAEIQNRVTEYHNMVHTWRAGLS